MTQIRLGDNELVNEGDEVALLPEFESMCDHPTYGVIRTIETFADREGWTCYKVGVLWFGYGGLWVRHYLAEQLMRANFRVKSAGPQVADGIPGEGDVRRRWYVAGNLADEAEVEKRSWEGDTARPIIQKMLEGLDSAGHIVNPQELLPAVLEAVSANPDCQGEPDEQLVRDVITEELALRQARINSRINEARRKERDEGHTNPVVILAVVAVLAVLLLSVAQGNLHDEAATLWDWLIQPFMDHPDGT